MSISSIHRMSLWNSITCLMPSVLFIQQWSICSLAESLLMFVTQFVRIRSPFQIQSVSIDRGRSVLQHIAHLGICWHDTNSLIAPGFMSCHRWKQDETSCSLQQSATRSCTSFFPLRNVHGWKLPEQLDRAGQVQQMSTNA